MARLRTIALRRDRQQQIFGYNSPRSNWTLPVFQHNARSEARIQQITKAK
jgi:hypothetical protein